MYSLEHYLFCLFFYFKWKIKLINNNNRNDNYLWARFMLRICILTMFVETSFNDYVFYMFLLTASHFPWLGIYYYIWSVVKKKKKSIINLQLISATIREPIEISLFFGYDIILSRNHLSRFRSRAHSKYCSIRSLTLYWNTGPWGI